MVATKRRGPKEPQPITSLVKAFKKGSKAAGYPGRIPHGLRRSAVRQFVRQRIPERVAMKITVHKTRSVFDHYDIVSGAICAMRRRSFQDLLVTSEVQKVVNGSTQAG